MEEIQDFDIEEILKAFPKLKTKEKANIKWLLLSFNPVPLEFYRYLNRKTKHTSVTSYVCAISAILTLSEGISEDRMLLFQNIQKSWKDGVFKNDWNTYIAERSTLMAIKSSYRVQKDYNNEISSQYPKKRKRDDPSTPNKPVIRSDMKQKYPQVAFLKKVKFAPEEPEDENPFRSKNSAERDNQNVVDPVNVVDWRECFRYEIRIKILSPYTAKNKFDDTMIRYTGKVLMDFVNRIIDVPGHVLSIDEVERDWIVTKISPLFTYLQATFINKVQFHWIEHDIEPTHERLVAGNNNSNKGRMKADIVGVRLSDNRQIVFLEMSGAPTDFLNVHTIGDTSKTIQERIDSLNSMLLNFLSYDIRYADKIRSLTIQGIRDRLTLRTIFLRGKEDYADEEEFSAIFPLSWDFRFQFLEIFKLMEYVIKSILDYPNVIKELTKHPAKSPEFSIRHCIS